MTEELKMTITVVFGVIALFVILHFCGVFESVKYRNDIQGKWVVCPQCDYQYRLSKQIHIHNAEMVIRDEQIEILSKQTDE